MSVVAAAVIGSAVTGLAGAAIGAKAAGRAADTQADSADRAAQLQNEQYQQNRADMEPWREAGTYALDRLVGGTRPGNVFASDFTMADFNKDPGYQFRMDEGQRAIEASAAARGGLLSGGNLKDINAYGQDYASGEYTNAYNRFNADRDRRFGRLSQLAGIGQTATGQIADQGSQSAARQGEYLTQGANARASGYVGQANAINQGLGTIGNYFGSQAFGQPQQSGQSWYSAGQPAAGASTGSWGTPGMNQFFYGSGTGGD